MSPIGRRLLGIASVVLAATATARCAEPPEVSERARRVHAGGLLFDGHNDLPWRLRTDGDVSFTRLDIGRRLDGRPDRSPPAPRGGRQGPVLVGLHPQRTSQPRADRHRADRPGPADGRALPRRPRAGRFRRRRRADRPCRQDRLADRHRRGRRDRERPGAAPGVLPPGSPVHDPDPQHHPRLGRRRSRRAPQRRALPLRRAGRPRDEPARHARRHLPRLARHDGRRAPRLAGPGDRQSLGGLRHRPQPAERARRDPVPGRRRTAGS